MASLRAGHLHTSAKRPPSSTFALRTCFYRSWNADWCDPALSNITQKLCGLGWHAS